MEYNTEGRRQKGEGAFVKEEYGHVKVELMYKYMYMYMFHEEIHVPTNYSNAVQLCQACLFSGQNLEATAANLIQRFFENNGRLSSLTGSESNVKSMLSNGQSHSHFCFITSIISEQVEGSGELFDLLQPKAQPVFVLIDESDTHQEKPSTNLTGEKPGHDGGPDENQKGAVVKRSGRKGGHSSVYGHKRVKLKNVQSSENLTGENSGGGYDPVYERQKLKKGCVDANQEKPAGNSTRKKSGGSNGPVYKHRKVNRSRQCGTSGCYSWTAYMKIFLLSTSLIPTVTSLSLSDNLNGSTMVCPGQQVRFDCFANSRELYWISPEYIGEPPGVRIGFSGELDWVGRTRPLLMGNATLLNVNGGNVTNSELVITVSQDFSTASITCSDTTQSVTRVLEVLGGPGIPHNVTASILSSSGDDCIILLHWDLPTDMTTSHVVVDFAEGTLEIPAKFTVAALPMEKCNLNLTIGIHAVDICGHQGTRAEVLLKDELQDPGNVTEYPSQTTAAPQPDASACTCDIRATIIALACVLAAFIVMCLITAGVLFCYLKRARKCDHDVKNSHNSLT